LALILLFDLGGGCSRRAGVIGVVKKGPAHQALGKTTIRRDILQVTVLAEKRKRQAREEGVIGCGYYSAEFSISGLGTPYRFKIRNDASTAMSVLVRDDSKLLPWLRVGDVVTVKYYADGSIYSAECLDTAICDIAKSDDGRFRGHHRVGLEIVRGTTQLRPTGSVIVLPKEDAMDCSREKYEKEERRGGHGTSA